VTALPASLVLVGAGKMGGAMLQGWLALGLEAGRIAVLDPYAAPELIALCAGAGVRLNPPPAAMKAPDVLVLAVKPQSFDAAASIVAMLVGEATLVLSIMAGKTIGDIATRLPKSGPIVRAMPNLPASIGRGITAAVANSAVTPRAHAMADRLLSAIGKVEWLDHEGLIDAVTAVSGSGPAYVFYLVECLAAAGVAAGLPGDLALRLARATVEGAGELMTRDPAAAPAQLRQNVTSPGGTTAAALSVLMRQDGLEKLMTDAVAAAKRRAQELAG
jgi:pyrroline-5-carboxylate reductase